MNHEFWYVSRAAAIAAYLLLSVSVALGIAIGTRLLDRVAHRRKVFDLHRFTTLLGLGFVLLHVFVLLGDAYFNFNVWQLTVPFLSPYRPWQTAVGVVSLYLFAAIVASFFLRQRLGFRAWRSLHYLTFVLYAAATVHGLTAGTDAGTPWMRAIYLLSGGAVLSLLAHRLQHRLPRPGVARSLRYASAGGAVVAAAVTLAFVFSAAPPRFAGSFAAVLPSAGFGGAFSGTYSITRTGASAQLVLDAIIQGDTPLRLRADVVQQGDGDADADGSLLRNVVELLDPSSGDVLCRGKLDALGGGALRASCSGTGASTDQVSISGRITSTDGSHLAGTLTATVAPTSTDE